MTEFHPNNWLGYGFNFLAQDATWPQDITTLAKNPGFVDRRSVNLSSKTTPFTWTKTKTTWNVPDNIVVRDDFNDFVEHVTTFASGTEVRNSMSAGAKLDVGYAGATVSGGVNYDSTETYNENQMWAFVVKEISGYNASISASNDTVAPSLIAEAKRLPTYSPTEEVKAKYHKFFTKWGTHVLTSTEYGWHFQLEASQSNTSGSSKESFQANVEVKYMGNGASADFKTSADYTEFNRSATATVRATGGNPAKAKAAEDDPANLAAKQTWLETAGTAPDEGLFNVGFKPISEIFTDFVDDDQGTFDNIRTQLASAVWDMSNSCHRRITVYWPHIKYAPFNAHLEADNARMVPFSGIRIDRDRKMATGSVYTGAGFDFSDCENCIVSDREGNSIGGYFDIASGVNSTTSFSYDGFCPDFMSAAADLQQADREFKVEVGRVGLDGAVKVLTTTSFSTNCGLHTPRSAPVEVQLKPEADQWWL